MSVRVSRLKRFLLVEVPWGNEILKVEKNKENHVSYVGEGQGHWDRKIY